MKAYVMTDSRLGYSTRKTNQCHNRGGCGNNTHKDQRGIRAPIILLPKVTTIRIGFALEPVVELGMHTAGHSKEVPMERWQRFEYITF